MKIDNLLKLLDNGFTKDEIMQLCGAEQPQEQPKEEQPQEQPQEQPKEESKQETPKGADEERFKSLETKLDYVINRFNYMAVQNSQLPDKQEKETVDSILAKIIN